MPTKGQNVSAYSLHVAEKGAQREMESFSREVPGRSAGHLQGLPRERSRGGAGSIVRDAPGRVGMYENVRNPQKPEVLLKS